MPVILHEPSLVIAGPEGEVMLLGKADEKIRILAVLVQPAGHTEVFGCVDVRQPEIRVEAGVVVAGGDAVIRLEPCAARLRGDKAVLVLLLAHQVDHRQTDRAGGRLIGVACHLAGNMRRRKRVEVVLVERIVGRRCGIVVAIVAVIAVKTKDSGSLGTYSCEIMSSDNSSTVFEITFNEKNNTYKENISVGDKAVELASGTFVRDGNKLTLTSDGGDVQNLVKQGKYLIAKDYLYEGEIPDGDTFDATCTFKNSNNV